MLSNPSSPGTRMEREFTAAPCEVVCQTPHALLSPSGDLDDAMLRYPSDATVHDEHLFGFAEGAGGATAVVSNGSLAGRMLHGVFDAMPSATNTPCSVRTAATTPEAPRIEAFAPLPQPARRTLGAVEPLTASARSDSDTPDVEFVVSGLRGEHSPAKAGDAEPLEVSPAPTHKATPGGRSAAGVRVRHHTSASTVAGFLKFAEALPAGIARGDYYLRLSDDGAGGTYFVMARGDDTHPMAVFKPRDEEVGCDDNPRGNSSIADDHRFEVGGFQPGDCHLREVLAYELDQSCQTPAGVPATVNVELDDGRVGSLQKFVPRMMQSWSTTPAQFDASSVHNIAVFDIRVLNCDRHGGNLLVPKDAPGLTMLPIDHGLVLPEQWVDPDFEWMSWPQARVPVSDATRAAVAALDADADAAKVEAALGVGPAEVMAVTTRLLQIALAQGKAYTLQDVARFCRRATMTEPAGLERVMNACRRDLDDGGDLNFAAVEATLANEFP